MDEEKKPMTISQLIEYLRRHLIYIEGVADGADIPQLQKRVNSMRNTINQYEKENN